MTAYNIQNMINVSLKFLMIIIALDSSTCESSSGVVSLQTFPATPGRHRSKVPVFFARLNRLSSTYRSRHPSVTHEFASNLIQDID